ncbi:MAG: uracil-DNA glycosylase [Bacteroidales bacterium]|nr:uracil-DNA glycosylase [Bacteroidales bacterium]
MTPRIEASWLEVLEEEFRKDYFLQLKEFLLEERKVYTVYPPGSRIFAAFNSTPFHSVKVVILGQDPYHGPGQAHGLCFSVPDGVRKPPSLVNIFKELQDDLGIQEPLNGNLEKWAAQGVLLLNATLTVRSNQAGSHQNKGWELFTDRVISLISEKKSGIVFLLWGNYAQAKVSLIDETKHLVLRAAHPSPFSVYRGFYGCRHFSATNNFLSKSGIAPVDWSLI